MSMALQVKKLEDQVAELTAKVEEYGKIVQAMKDDVVIYPDTLKIPPFPNLLKQLGYKDPAERANPLSAA